MDYDVTGDAQPAAEAHDAAMRARDALDRLGAILADLVDSPRTRALRNEAQGYARTVGKWTETPPDAQERATLIARVHALHDCALVIRMRHATLASTKVPSPASGRR